MSRWTVLFEASATVSVDAETEDEAREAAQKTLRAIITDSSCLKQLAACYLNVSVNKDK